MDQENSAKTADVEKPLDVPAPAPAPAPETPTQPTTPEELPSPPKQEQEQEPTTTTPPTHKFILPPMQLNEQGWGPSPLPAKEAGVTVPFQSFNKGDRLGRSADWSTSYRGGHQSRFQQDRSQAGSSASATSQNAFFFKSQEEERDEFHIVDTLSATTKKTQRKRGGAALLSQRGKPFSAFSRSNFPQSPSRRGGQTTRGGSSFRGRQSSYFTVIRPSWDWRSQKQMRESSIEVQPFWVVKEQFEFSVLAKFLEDIPKAEDLETCGSLCSLDRKFSAISTANEVPLERVERTFFSVTTSDDPIIKELGDQGNVFATDLILASLMCSPRSIYPWDITVTRVGTSLYFDKRAESTLDLLTVNETLVEQTMQEDKDQATKQLILAHEATYVNHMYTQQVLNKSDLVEFERDNPFPALQQQQQQHEPAPVAYRYRRWKLSEDITLVARCQVNGTLDHDKDTEAYCMVTSLLETDPKTSDWRRKLDTQRGVVLATELKNNSFRLARFTQQAMLAAVPELHIGYISRVPDKDPVKHSIVGTQQYHTKDFAAQINLNPKNTWAVLRKIIEVCMAQPPGKYVLMRDPNKPVVRLYAIPETAAATPTATTTTTTTPTTETSST